MICVTAFTSAVAPAAVGNAADVNIHIECRCIFVNGLWQGVSSGFV